MSVTLVVTNRRASEHGAPPATLTFNQPRIVIGRGAHADVLLPSRAVSETHAVLHLDAGDLAVSDEGSTNGTSVNGQPVVHGRRKALRHGDEIAIVEFSLRVEISVAAVDPPERTASVARKLLADLLATHGREASPPSLELLTGRRAGTTFALAAPGATLIAGRGDGCEILLDDPDCSRQHAEFVRDADGVLVRDLGSKNGVLVGDRRVTERRLRDGDQIDLGRSALRFDDPADEMLRAIEQGPDEPSRKSTAEPATRTPSLPPTAVATPAPKPATASRSAPPDRSAATVPPRVEPAPATLARRRGSADWVVIVLAVVILAISVTALWVVLRGTPPAPH